MFFSVDFAKKHSAAILRDYEGKILWEGDSGNDSPFQWVRRLKSVADHAQPDHFVVEDVPYGVSSQAMTKGVTRLQGALMLLLEEHEFYFLNPSTWMKDYEGVGRAPKGLSKAESLKYRDSKALEHANRLGYTPPDLVKAYTDSLPEGSKVLKKNTDPYKKAMTDYVMAFLINDWLVNHKDEYKTITGVQVPLI